MSKLSSLFLQVEAPARMIIKNPLTGEPLLDSNGNPAWIDIASSESKKGQAANRAAMNRRLKSRSRQLSAEEIEQESLELLCALTVDWYLVGLNGERIEAAFTPTNVREAYEGAPWLQKQVDAFAGDLGNYRPEQNATN